MKVVLVAVIVVMFAYTLLAATVVFSAVAVRAFVLAVAFEVEGLSVAVWAVVLVEVVVL